MRILFLCLLGAGFGLLASAGVFNIFVAVGLVPRFAGKTHTASKILVYEEMVVFGTLIGGFVSLFPQFCQFAGWWQDYLGVNTLLNGQQTAAGVMQAQAGYAALLQGLGILGQLIFGLFSGMFVGCLALAIAEMLDSFPILARRVSFRHGLGFAILSMACGKVFGALWYFWGELQNTLE